MTPEERQLIADLFDRMRRHSVTTKDREAESLINQSLLTTPDAGYMLVQSVLVTEQALKQAGERIEELEARLRELDRDDRGRPGERGSFLGDTPRRERWGQEAQSRPTSVPPIAARTYPREPEDEAWQRGGTARDVPQPPPSSTGGSFLGTAMATAAGVLGGVLLSDTIRRTMGWHQQGTGPTSQVGGGDADTPVYEDIEQNADTDEIIETIDEGSDSADSGGGIDV
jgi:hypothetical protein